MARVTGIGGIFFKSPAPEKLAAWYREHLGVPTDGEMAIFNWKDALPESGDGMTVFTIFDATSDYFEPTTAAFMINFIVDDLDELLENLSKSGIKIHDHRDDPYGKFAWLQDPDGNKIELWQPNPN